MTATSADGTGPPHGLLAGVRVVDLSRVLAGPFGAMQLSEMGADVVKVEFPSGDPVREVGPHRGERSLYFSAVNTGKRGVVLDPSEPTGRRHLDDLLAAADVVVENFRPDAARELGLDVASLRARHPHLVVITVSGYASDSVRAGEAAYDVSVQAEAGIMSVTGMSEGPPARAGVPLSDLAGGMYAALAAVSGLVSRATTGRGIHVEVPLLDATLPLLSYMATAAAEAGIDPPPVGSGHHRIVPYGAYEARDGWVVIAALADKFWSPLCDALGLAELRDREDLQVNAGRLAARDEVDVAVARSMASVSVQVAVDRLRDAGVPAAPVLGITDALATDYVTQRGMVRQVDAPEGTYTLVQGPLRAAGTDRPAPALGEHTKEVITQWAAEGQGERPTTSRGRASTDQKGAET